jgi:energy-converting hydrogenase Eha subunit E
MANRTGSPLVLLLNGLAAVTAGGALVADLAFDEHPIHSIVLAAVVAVTAFLRKRASRTGTVVPAVSAALAVQPLLHVVSETDLPHDLGPGHSSPVLHLLVSELPTAGVQIAVPALALAAFTVCAHLLYLRIAAARRPQALLRVPAEPTRMPVPVRAGRLGSMLRWCGWALQAARRGPPVVAG